MLLIDGVKYEEWVPQGPQAEDEFEHEVKEHTQDIFGEKSIYFDRKQKLKSLSGVGSIPDGYVIVLGDSPHWHIVEVELSSHPLHEHIVSQLSKFILGIQNPSTQRNIAGAIYEYISGDAFLTLKLKKETNCVDVHKFLSDLISKSPVLTIIIEKEKDELRESLNIFRRDYQIKFVEFQTFTREGIGLGVHAHLFEPLCAPSPIKIGIAETPKEEITTTRGVEERLTIRDLINAGIVKVGQIIWGWHKGKRYDACILDDGRIRLVHDSSEYNSLSVAAFKGVVGHEINGWKWWHTKRESGKECKLDDLRHEYKSKLSS